MAQGPERITIERGIQFLQQCAVSDGVGPGPAERIQHALEFDIEDAVAVEHVRAKLSPVARMIGVSEQATLRATGGRQPDLRRRDADVLRQKLEQSRVDAPLIFSNAELLDVAGEDREGGTVVADVGRAHVGQGHPGRGYAHQVGYVGRRIEHFVPANTTGESDQDDPFGLPAELRPARRSEARPGLPLRHQPTAAGNRGEKPGSEACLGASPWGSIVLVFGRADESPDYEHRPGAGIRQNLAKLAGLAL